MFFKSVLSFVLFSVTTSALHIQMYYRMKYNQELYFNQIGLLHALFHKIQTKTSYINIIALVRTKQ